MIAGASYAGLHVVLRLATKLRDNPGVSTHARLRRASRDSVQVSIRAVQTAGRGRVGLGIQGTSCLASS